MKITGTNVFSLARHFDGKDTASARCESVSFHHLNRCLKAGLFEAVPEDKTTVRLTDAGRAAIAAHNLARGVVSK